MHSADRLRSEADAAAPRAEARGVVLRSLEGTIQRIDHQGGALQVVAHDRLWRFAVPADCRLWFGGEPAPFRYFQPLNHVLVYYEFRDGEQVVQAMFGSESGPVPVPADLNR